MADTEKRDILEELEEKIREATEIAQMLGRGYREDQINASLTGTEGEFIGDGIPDWIKELKNELEPREDEDPEPDDEPPVGYHYESKENG